MAKFNVTERTYRNRRVYEPGDVFVCSDDEASQHEGSRALKRVAEEKPAEKPAAKAGEHGGSKK